MSLANTITLARLPMLLLAVAFLFPPVQGLRFLGLGLLAFLYLMDWLDGYVARRRQEVTEMGAVLDVALDRVVENTLWVVFMYLGLVPLWVPIVFLVRSFLVDGIRGLALARGKAGFGMMHSPWGRFLVSSRLMRAVYGIAKGGVFGCLYLTRALALGDPGLAAALQPLNQGLIFLAVGLCILRGIPVVMDGRIYFSPESKER